MNIIHENARHSINLVRLYLLPKGSNYAIERGSNVGEISDATSDQKGSLTTIGVRSSALPMKSGDCSSIRFPRVITSIM